MWLKGIYIQLSDNEKYKLSDAENSFHKALELEPKYKDDVQIGFWEKLERIYK